MVESLRDTDELGTPEQEVGGAAVWQRDCGDLVTGN